MGFFRNSIIHNNLFRKKNDTVQNNHPNSNFIRKIKEIYHKRQTSKNALNKVQFNKVTNNRLFLFI
jgi:hypothetical protein